MPIIKNMKKVMHDNLGLRNKSATATDATQKACMLDPRMKDLRFLKQEEKSKIKECLIDEAHTIANNPRPAPRNTIKTETELEAATIKTELDLPTVPSQSGMH